jgi:cell division transport system permease protein
MMRAFRYAVDEALASLWRGRQSGLLSTSTIALALFILGGFLFVTSNLDRLGSEWGSTAEISVYLKDDVTPEQRAAIEQAFASRAAIVDSEYISKAAALARFKETFGDLGTAIDTVGGNPLPASYEVRWHSGSGEQAEMDSLGAVLRRTPGVADVRYDREWIGRLLTTVNVVRGIGWVLGSLLTVAAALTVANVVRLSLYARRDELEIMQLVGAPTAYIRGPFVMEGLLQGGIGAIAALVALAIGFLVLRARYLTPLASAVNLSAIRFLPVELSAGLVVGGMLVGCLGGLVAAWHLTDS